MKACLLKNIFCYSIAVMVYENLMIFCSEISYGALQNLSAIEKQRL